VIVDVDVIVNVDDTVIVAALVNGNDPVDVTDTGNDPIDLRPPHGSTSLVSIATTLSNNSMPLPYCAESINPSTFMTSKCDAHSIADPLAIA
jgi:hypothetical protein